MIGISNEYKSNTRYKIDELSEHSCRHWIIAWINELKTVSEIIAIAVEPPNSDGFMICCVMEWTAVCRRCNDCKLCGCKWIRQVIIYSWYKTLRENF